MERKKTWIIYGAALLISVCIPRTVYAGSINGNEQSVLSAASGQFEKDGIIYEVRPEYINSAKSYLSQDDVDLTAEQAQAAIAEIYANVQTGVESGYLIEVGKTAPETKPSSKESEKPQESEKISPSSQAESSKEETAQAPKEPQSPESNPTPSDETDEPESKSVSPVISILELVDKAPQQTYEYMYTDTNTLMQRFHINYSLLEIIMMASSAAVVLTAVIAVYKKLLTIHKHRTLRQILKWILTLTMAVLSGVLCIFLGFWFGAFQENAILGKLADTGYYTAIYDELRRDTSISFALLDIPNDVMDHSITYEKVIIASRQQVENDLKKGTYKADTTLLIEPLKNDIEEYLKGQSITITEEAEAGLNLLMKRLEGKYTALLKWPFASWWILLKSDFMKSVVVLLPVTIFLMVAAQVLVIFLHHYKHRGFSLGAKGIIGGSCISFLIFTAGNLMVSRQWKEITPSYMNSFFLTYRTGIWISGAVVCGIGVLLGGVMLAAVNAWKDGR